MRSFRRQFHSIAGAGQGCFLFLIFSIALIKNGVHWADAGDGGFVESLVKVRRWRVSSRWAENPLYDTTLFISHFCGSLFCQQCNKYCCLAHNPPRTDILNSPFMNSARYLPFESSECYSISTRQVDGNISGQGH